MEVAVGLALLALPATTTAVLVRTRRAPAGLLATPPVVIAVLLAAAAVVVAVVSRVGVLPGLDLPLLDAAVALRSPALTAVAEGLSLGGGTVPTGAAAVLAALLLWRRGRPWSALLWVAGVLAGSLTVRYLKLAVERPRPPVAGRLVVETTTSLPSGHALMAALGLGLVALAGPVLLPGHRRVRRAVVAVAVVLTLLIGGSRVYLGVHWTSDVLVGWLLGATLALVARTVAGLLDPAGGPPDAERYETGRSDRTKIPRSDGRDRAGGDGARRTDG